MIITRIKFLLLAGFLATSIQLARSAETPTLIDRPTAESGPTQISVAIWFVDVSSIDSAQQSFTADVVADGTVIYRQRLVGSFTQALVLKSFPFDKQVFRVQLAAVKYSPSEVSLVPDEKWIAAGINWATGISPSITLPDWTVEKWDVKPLVYTLAPGLENSGYAVEFTASRNVQHYILKVILPLVLIVMMSWAVFWIDPVTSNSQISIAVTSMLTLIAYRFAVDSQLPRLPYMTRLDAFFLTSTLLGFFSLIEVLLTTILDSNQQTERAKKIDRYCPVIVPVIFAIASIAIFAHPRG